MKWQPNAFMGNADAKAVFEITDLVEVQAKAGQIFLLRDFQAINVGLGTEKIAHLRKTLEVIIKFVHDIGSIWLNDLPLHLLQDGDIRLAQIHQRQAGLAGLGIKTQQLA